MDAAVLLERAGGYLPQEKLAMVEAAYQFALKAHQGQKRKSGGPYMEHPLETASLLADLELDASTLVASLLHDVPEDCGVPLSEIERNFGSEVKKLVDATTKLSKVAWRSSSETDVSQKRHGKRGSQAEYLRRMLIAMAEDLRVVFIKLADRLHNMRTLGALSLEKRRTIAKETLEIYAPLAHRLGIWGIKWQLEDLAFRYLDPQHYHRVARLVATRRTQRESFVNEIVQTLETELTKAGIKAEVSGRPKHIYSIYKKMEKYSASGKDFGDVHDLFAFRILVDTVSDCYKSLGVVHNLWHPFPEEFDDFIANPKDNGYQSLHTIVMGPGAPLEIQIRTYEMHRIDEYGVAAHWRYKEGETKDLHFEQKLAWLRQLIEWQEELSTEEFLESVKTDVFIDQVFVYTPKGEIIDLAKGATPLDFAYRIHTELGHRCIGAKVNNRLVPLNYELKNGEIVEILISKGVKGPSLDWLNPDLGYVKTSHAREKVRQWFKKQERAQNIERGRQLLDKELKRLGVSLTNLEEIARLFNFEDVDEFFAALGYGGITPHQVALKLTTEPEPPRATVEVLPSKKISSATIEVLGVGDLLTRLARCCHPLPGDEIIGYITRSQGVTVHRKDCHTILNQMERERLIGVNWGSVQEVYPVVIQVDAWDRVGLLRDITTVIAEDRINITGVNMMEHGDSAVSVLLTVEIKNMAQLTRLLSRIQGVRSVTNAARRSEAGADLSLKT